MRRLAFVVPLILAGCAAAMRGPVVEHAWLVRGEGTALQARALVHGTGCPTLDVDGSTVSMRLRAPAADVPARPVAQGVTRPARFDLAVCEADLAPGSRRVRAGDIVLAAHAGVAERIVVIGDTGCRMKQSEGLFQSCVDGAAWPFAQVARSAAALRPDLVIHVGDYHYRESACPPGEQACAGSPWGFGQDSWTADFFAPARPLLHAAPWVFVRGNHEECARAGQGWFRFLDAAPWTAGRSCDDPRNDGAARHTAPYAVALDPQTSLIVFDSSTQAGSAAEFAREFGQVDALARTVPHALFASHHPVLGLGLPSAGKPIGPSDPDMIAALQAARGGALFGPSVDMALHGHVHLFEALGFTPGGVPTFVLGNSGSMGEGGLPPALPEPARAIGGVRIAAFHTRVGFGFALLERRDALWRLTEYAEDGRPLLACEVAAPTLHCAPASSH
jgi:hypothetical protein